MPRLAIDWIDCVTIILVLLFIRFRFTDRLNASVRRILDVIIGILLVILIVICISFAAA